MTTIGELAVVLGVKSGNALNALTNFSIKFLALKVAAEQLGGVFDNLFGEVARYGQQLNQTSRNLNLSTEWLQQMKIRAEQAGGSLEDVLGVIRHLMKENARIMMNEGDAGPFGILNINMSKLHDPVKLLDDILGRVSRLNSAFRDVMLEKLGIPVSVWNMYLEKTVGIDKKLFLTKKETQDLNELRKEYVALQQTVSMGWDKLIAKNADTIKKLVGWLKDLSKEFFKFLQLIIDMARDSGSFEEFLNKLSKGLKDQAKDAREFANAIMNIAKAVNYLADKWKKFTTVEVKEVKPEERKGLKETWESFKNNLFSGGINKSGEGSSIEIDAAPEPLYNYGSGGVVYNDNSQITINTSEGAEVFTRINNERITKMENKFQTGYLQQSSTRFK